MSTEAPSVYLGNINPGSVSSGFLRSMLECRADGTVSRMDIEDAPPYLDIYRNKVCRRFMASDEDYLLFVDSDVQFQPSDIRTLYSHASQESVVGGVYFSAPASGLSPVIFDYTYNEEFDTDLLQFIGEEKYNTLVEKYDSGLIPVEGIGTGFMMIPRNVLQVMDDSELYTPAYPYFAELSIDNIACGEDLTFCQRLIRNHSISVYADPTVRVKHYKTICFA